MHFKAENLTIPKQTRLPSSKFRGATALQNKVSFFLGHPVGRKWCSALNACVLSEAFMILCPPDDLFSSVKLETVAVENEDREGFSIMLFKVLVVVLILFWLFWFIFLR